MTPRKSSTYILSATSRKIHLKNFGVWDRILIHCGSFLITLMLNFIGKTLRIRVHGRKNYIRVAREKGFIYALWHGKLLLPLYSERGKGIKVLVSEHRDGELVAQILLRYGYKVIRGSTTRGGRKAMIELLKSSKSGGNFAFTPDGPRGPKGIVQPGVIFLARKTGFPILPITGSSKWKIELGSWDRFLIPIPFSKASVVFGSPIYLKGNLNGEESSKIRDVLQEDLNRATEIADSLCR